MCLIQLQRVSLTYPQKTCFSNFSTQIMWGQRIAIVGDNGVGKSSLLRMLRGELPPSEGIITKQSEVGIGYVQQIHDQADGLSGGQRVNFAISQALATGNEMLLLDEPTNHLDSNNRRSLMKMLNHYHGSIVLVTHDQALMDQVCDTIWHITSQKIHVFNGRYRDYRSQLQNEADSLERQLSTLKHAQQDAHHDLMKEQKRAANARQRGAISIEQRRWPTVKSLTKLGRSNTTAGSKQAEIKEQRQNLAQQLAELPRHEKIQARFHFPHQSATPVNVVQIIDGAISYTEQNLPVLKQINLTVASGERWAICGKNGSGKSTLARAILNDLAIVRSGDWHTPIRIGFLDQHYQNLNPDSSVLECLVKTAPHWSELEYRRHLSDFLFRGELAVHSNVKQLSGGEKARLSLACIAAQTPQLLILDELTNNLDRNTRQHVIEILKDYPGTLILISHDAEFLEQLGDVQRYNVLH